MLWQLLVMNRKCLWMNLIAYIDQEHISLFYPLSFKPVLFSVVVCVKVLGTLATLQCILLGMTGRPT